MTVKKARKILDWWINEREIKIKELETDFKFNDDELAATLHNNEQTIIDNLKLIKKELVSKCKHPKNMHDTCKGVKYCMECNEDL